MTPGGESANPLLAIWVAGWPRTKGSLTPVIDWARRTWYLEDTEHSKKWRQHVCNEVVRSVRARMRAGEKWEPIEGGIWVSMHFRYVRPEGDDVPDFPIIRSGENANGDLDKLMRNVCDAIQKPMKNEKGCASFIADDCQVVDAVLSKRWGPRNGVRIEIRRAEP